MFLCLRRLTNNRQFDRFASVAGHFAHSIPVNRHMPFRAAIMQSQTPPRSSDTGRIDAKKRKMSAKKVERAKKSSGFDEVLQIDIDQLLKTKWNGTTDSSLPEPFTEIELKILDLSSTGDGLALSEGAEHVYVVPFTVPGDKVLAKVVRHYPALSYSIVDFIKVIEPGPKRDDSLVRCGYFAKCSGCQLQMMSYEDQLVHKKRVVEKAYSNFSGLLPELVPPVGDTFPSPMQYGYRTKLTPHFTSSHTNVRRKNRAYMEPPKEVPPIGFTYKNRRLDMDIEDCPLGTDIVRLGLKSERKRVANNLGKFPKGATLLLRESTTRIPKVDRDNGESDFPLPPNEPGTDSGDVLRVEHDDFVDEKRCITDQNAMSVEYIDNYVLTNKAGAFFQNNNSILPGVTEFIRQHCVPENNDQDPKPVKYLLDAYSGSGLFTITLSPLFVSTMGIDVSGPSIDSARFNARANHTSNTGFVDNDAATLFKDVPYPPDQTALIIDPPRKGCSDDFLRQLLSFAPRHVVYVSCNVHTQARDVAVLVEGDSQSKVRYEILSVRGFDFFPQTGHVEGVAILSKVSSSGQ